MTQEDKELLLKDLCARLPYGVKIRIEYPFLKEEEWHPEILYGLDLQRLCIANTSISLEEFKPYLFPLSSMTEVIKDEIYQETGLYDIFEDEQIHIEVGTNFADVCKLFNILNKHHFDYNNLISKGLANDATGLDIY
jgi:hypothetical protein